MQNIIRLLLPFSFLLSTLCCCGKENGGGNAEPETQIPTAVTVNPGSISAPAEGGSFEVALAAPARPKVEIPSAAKGWLSLKDGTFKDYKMTVTLEVAANDATEAREADVTVSATGVSSVTLKVSQAAKESDPDPSTPGANVNQELIDLLGLGWNMGNHFDAYYNGSWAGEKEGYPDETCWGNVPATQATFDGVKSLGFTSVRIPISWLNMIGPAPDYKIDETWMNRIYEVVQMAHQDGLRVIINTHHDENHGVNNSYQWLDIKNAANNSALNESIKAKIEAVWTQIARKFADCGDWLIMEGFNELNDGQWGWSEDFRKNPTRQCNILNEWNQVFVTAVRATGGNNSGRWLGVPTYAANPEYEKYWTLPADPAGKTILAVHFYDPSDYTIGEKQYSDWGHTGAAGRKASGGDEDHVQAVFGNLYNKYVSRGVPVYLGEFGCSMRAKSDARAWAFYKYYLEYVVKAARTYGLPCYLWDNGTDGTGAERHGYINHGTGSPVGSSREVLDVMRKAWFTDAEGYTLETVYNNAPRF